MRSMVWLAFVLSWLRSVSGFTFSLDDTKLSTCGSTTITWKGGQPPFGLMILPTYGTPNNVTVPDTAWNGDSNSGQFSWTINYPKDTQFLAVMSDQSGFGTGGASPIYKITSSDGATSCPDQPSPGNSVQFRLNSTSINQCQPVQIQHLSPFPVKVVAAVAGGPLIDTGDLDFGDKDGLTWLPNVASGSQIVLAAIRSPRRGGIHGGGPPGPPPWGGFGGKGGGHFGTSDNVTARALVSSRQGWGGGGGPPTGIDSIVFTVGDGPSDCLDGNSTSTSGGPLTLTPAASGTGTGTANGANASLNPGNMSFGANGTADAAVAKGEDDENSHPKGLGTGAIIAIVIGAIGVLSGIVSTILFFGCRRRLHPDYASRNYDNQSRRTSGGGTGPLELKAEQIDLLYANGSETPRTADFGVVQNPFESSFTGATGPFKGQGQGQTGMRDSHGTTGTGNTYPSTGIRYQPSSYSGSRDDTGMATSPYRDDHPHHHSQHQYRSTDSPTRPRIDTTSLHPYPPNSSGLDTKDSHLGPNAGDTRPGPDPSSGLAGLLSPTFGNGTLPPKSPALTPAHPFAQSYRNPNANPKPMANTHPTETLSQNLGVDRWNRRQSQYSAVTSPTTCSSEETSALSPVKAQLATWSVMYQSQGSLRHTGLGSLGTGDNANSTTNRDSTIDARLAEERGYGEGPRGFGARALPARPLSGALLLHQDAGIIIEESPHRTRARGEGEEHDEGGEEEGDLVLEELPPTYKHEWDGQRRKRGGVI